MKACAVRAHFLVTDYGNLFATLPEMGRWSAVATKGTETLDTKVILLEQHVPISVLLERPLKERVLYLRGGIQ